MFPKAELPWYPYYYVLVCCTSERLSEKYPDIVFEFRAGGGGINRVCTVELRPLV